MSALAWTSCPRCGGKAVVGLVTAPRRALAVGCVGGCRWVAPVTDPAVFGISAAAARRAIVGPHDGGGPPARGGLRSLALGHRSAPGSGVGAIAGAA